MATDGNYFALQPLIMQRIREAKIPGLGEIMPARDLHLLEEQRIDDAAVYVLYDKESVPNGSDYQPGEWQLVQQQWLIVLCTKNYADARCGDLDRAGPLLYAINKTLQGWRPGSGLGPLTKVGSPSASYSEKTSLYPLRYTSLIQLEGNNPYE